MRKATELLGLDLLDSFPHLDELLCSGGATIDTKFGDIALATFREFLINEEALQYLLVRRAYNQSEVL